MEATEIKPSDVPDRVSIAQELGLGDDAMAKVVDAEEQASREKAAQLERMREMQERAKGEADSALAGLLVDSKMPYPLGIPESQRDQTAARYLLGAIGSRTTIRTGQSESRPRQFQLGGRRVVIGVDWRAKGEPLPGDRTPGQEASEKEAFLVLKPAPSYQRASVARG